MKHKIYDSVFLKPDSCVFSYILKQIGNNKNEIRLNVKYFSWWFSLQLISLSISCKWRMTSEKIHQKIWARLRSRTMTLKWVFFLDHPSWIVLQPELSKLLATTCVEKPMCSHRRPARNCLSAIWTRLYLIHWRLPSAIFDADGTILGMCQVNVSPQMSRLCEGLAAVWTYIWALRGVCSEMHLEQSLARERSVTVGAVVRTQSSVSETVFVQRLSRSKW